MNWSVHQYQKPTMAEPISAPSQKDLISEAKRVIKHWWLSLVVGVLAIVVGVWSLCTPVDTFLALTLLFVVAFLVEGVLEVVFSVANRRTVHGWGWGLVMGVVDVVFAVFLMRNLELTPVVFGYVIAFWLLFRSVWGITVSIDLNDYGVRGWGWLLALSVVGVLLAALMLFFPLLAASFIVYLVGFALMLYGVFRIYLGFRLKSLGDE